LSDIELDNDDLSGDLNLSDCDDGAREVLKVQKFEKRAKRKAPAKKAKKVFRQEFDTNVYEVAFACLEHKGDIATGDAEFCQKCKCVFNSNSVIRDIEGH
jgi:hypothetical protein